MKLLIRDLVPTKLQVPIKYRINSWRNQLEPELKLLPWLVKPSERAIDIGGNRGVYAYALWRIDASVEIFEPNPVCAKVLKAWAASKDAVILHTIALSDKSGVADLHIPTDASGIEHDASASLEPKNFTSMRDETVSLATLDSFAFQEVGFVKIDVEGHEFNVLRGAEILLLTQQPSVLVEIEQRHSERPVDEIFDLLRAWGFQGFFLDEGRLTPLASFEVSNDQNVNSFSCRGSRYINNFLFLNEDRLQRGDYVDLFDAWGGR